MFGNASSVRSTAISSTLWPPNSLLPHPGPEIGSALLCSALLCSFGPRRHRANQSKGIKRASLHIGGHRLLHKMGRGCPQLRRTKSSSSSFSKVTSYADWGYHHYRQRVEFCEQSGTGTRYSAISSSTIVTISSTDQWCHKQGTYPYHGDIETGTRSYLKRCGHIEPPSTGATPWYFDLDLRNGGSIAQVEIPSLRVLTESEVDEAKWKRARYEQMNVVFKHYVTLKLTKGESLDKKENQAPTVPRRRPCSTFVPSTLTLPNPSRGILPIGLGRTQRRKLKCALAHWSKRRLRRLACIH